MSTAAIIASPITPAFFNQDKPKVDPHKANSAKDLGDSNHSLLDDLQKFLSAAQELMQAWPQLKQLGHLFHQTLSDIAKGDSKALREDIQKFRAEGPAGKACGHFLQELGQLCQDFGKDLPGNSKIKAFIEDFGHLLSNIGHAITDEPDHERGAQIEKNTSKIAQHHGKMMENIASYTWMPITMSKPRRHLA